MTHDPAKFVFSHRSNSKHAHNTRRGTQYWNHWFKVFRCPVCGRVTKAKGARKMCRGMDS